MSGFNKTLLSCAIALSNLANANTGNPFIDDTSIKGRLRTVFYNIEDTYDKDQGADYYRTGAWTGGVHLNLASGYLYNALAVGGSFYGATKLGTLSNNDLTSSTSSYQLLKEDGEGFAKLGQAWVDLRFGRDQGFSGHAKIGRQLLYNGLISSSGSRTVPSTWEGVNINAGIGDFSFGLAWVNRMSLRDRDEFYRLEDFNGNKIDYIMGGELAYTFRLGSGELTLKYRNAFSKDILQGHNGDILWKMPLGQGMSLALGMKYYQTQEDGELWDGYAWWAPAFDDKATAYNLNATLEVNSWSFRTSLSQFESKFTQYKPGDFSNNGYAPPGKYYYDYGMNTHGIWDFPTSGFAEDMLYDGELAWMLGVEYDFSGMGMPGLKAGYAFHYGSGMEVIQQLTRAKVEVSENEHDFHITYAFPQEHLKGLKFKLEYGIYRNDKELRQAISKEENDLRVWLDYDFKCF